MHTGNVGVRIVECALQQVSEIPGVQDGVLRNLVYLLSVAQYVGQSPEPHTEVSIKAKELAHALGYIPAQVVLLSIELNLWNREVGLEPLGNADGTAAGTSPTVWSREGLVEVKVHNVHAPVSRPRYPDEGVEVRPVHVKESVSAVQLIRHVLYLPLEYPEGVRVRYHQRCSSIVQLLHKVVPVQFAVLGALYGYHLEAAYRRRGWICPVGRVRDQDLSLSVVSPVPMVGEDQEKPQELPLRPSRWLQRHVRKTTQLF